jgi:ADP-ribosylglycohydrolase
MTDDKPVPKAERDRAEQIAGVILGTAVGDALGLPRVGLSRSRARKLFGNPSSEVVDV